MIDQTSKSVLDVGCGKGSIIIRRISNKLKNRYIVGCDIFPSYLKNNKQIRLYDECVLADARCLPFKHNSFELVLCLEVIEHLEKYEGEELLINLMDISLKNVVISTPVGFMYQNAFESNLYQTHKSAWFPTEFKIRGYRVIGVAGPLFIRGRKKYSMSQKYLLSLAQISSFILQPLFYIIPDISFQMICSMKINSIFTYRNVISNKHENQFRGTVENLTLI